MFKKGDIVWSCGFGRRNLTVTRVMSDFEIEVEGERFHEREKDIADGWHREKWREYIFALSSTPRQEGIELHKKWKWDSIIRRDKLSCKVRHFYLDYLEGTLDLNPVYQRELVWTLEQKQKYIMAIFEEKAEITPTLVANWGGHEDKYEVLDGKQRITTVFDFINNELELENGMKFRDLSQKDANWLLSGIDIRYTRISKQNMGDLTLDEKIGLFLEINELGTKMSQSHINKVKAFAKAQKEG